MAYKQTTERLNVCEREREKEKEKQFYIAQGHYVCEKWLSSHMLLFKADANLSLKTSVNKHDFDKT